MEELISISVAAEKIGITPDILIYQIQHGKLDSVNDCISQFDLNRILEQKRNYESLSNFIRSQKGRLFDAKKAKCRSDYFEYLEKNDFFGARDDIIASDNMLFVYPDAEVEFLSLDLLEIIRYKSESFFEEYGLPKEELFDKEYRRIKHTKDKEYLLKYLEIESKKEKNIFTKSYMDFVRILAEMPNIYNVTGEDIKEALDNVKIKETAEHIRKFYNYVRQFENVNYINISPKQKESEHIVAYSYKSYVCMAKALFNSSLIAKNNLIERALEDHFLAETWLFLSVHYMCAWRASDICDNWIYPDICRKKEKYGIDIDTLKDDILNKKISKEKYVEIADYVIKKTELSYRLPRKTSSTLADKLRLEIAPEFKDFLGMLILIAEYHHYKINDGYIKSNRISRYCNWVKCQQYFGENIAFIGNRNIQTRRLNKSYMQCLENAALVNGNTTLVASMVAQMSRSHLNLDTTLIYLQDHGVTEESADIVLGLMVQRGVMGMYFYNFLLTCYPDAINRMSIEEQTQVMKRIGVSPLELEVVSSVYLARKSIKEEFITGNKEEAITVLKGMFLVGNNLGKGKDCGIFCKRRILGEMCEHKHYESCIANWCPHHIFTSKGLPSLMEVIQDYNEKKKGKNGKKYEMILDKILMPRFVDIVNELAKHMSKSEQKVLKKYITENIYKG